MKTHPLLQRYRPDDVVTWRQGRPLTAAAFLATAHALAARLPRAGHALNLCEDRAEFLLGFAAALIAGQVTLLPPSRTPAALRRLCETHAGVVCLCDRAAALDDVWAPEDAPIAGSVKTVDVRLTPSAAPDDPDNLDDLDQLGAPGLAGIPEIPARRPVLVVFTSGSTGEPAPQAKTWGSLVAGAETLGREIGLTPGASVLGTVPAQHFYGVETTVMLPLVWGAGVHPGRPLLPADIDRALSELPAPRWLMTTPLHLRACAATTDAAAAGSPGKNPDKNPGQSPNKNPAGVLSATMPLNAVLARDTERFWQTAVYDVYGCTEAGIVALRRPAVGEAWRACAGVRFWQEDGDTWAAGAQLAEPVRLADRLRLLGDTGFELQGRAGDLVKIGGKRASLAALQAELAGVPGVVDGVFYWPEHAEPGRERLAALAVAPGLTPRAVLDGLRGRIDPVFLPRPLYLVDALPRNALGKLPRENLARAVALLARGRGQVDPAL